MSRHYCDPANPCRACRDAIEDRDNGSPEQRFDVESDRRGTPAERRFERQVYGP